jgi:ABC-type phosphate transport system substrate-binding protein
MPFSRRARHALALIPGVLLAVAAPAAHAQYPDPLYPSTHDQPCEASATVTRGIGASLQRIAQLNWGAQIIAPDPANPLAKGFGYDVSACRAYKLPADGGTRKVTYAPSGSGSALTAFGATDTPGSTRSLDVDFGGTDKPPTGEQIANANEGTNIVGGPDGDDARLETIPIAQAAVAPVVRVPDGCQIGNTSARQLSKLKLEGFFRGLTAYDTFGELFGYTNVKASTGSGFTDQQCQAKKPKRVVRFDESGTTFILKKYLQLAAGGAFDWREPDQGGTLPNTAWPAPTLTAGVNGNGPMLDTLSAQGATGGIAYSDLGAARGRNYAWDYSAGADGGTAIATDRTLWLRAQRIADGVYVSPARSDNQLGPRGARCSHVTYAGQPADTGGSWFNADAVLTNTDYAICGLTYALAWDRPAAVGITSPGRAVGRRDYIGYMLDRPGLGTAPPTSQCVSGDDRYGRGQCKLALNDYARLPSSVLTAAQAAMVELGL